MAARVLVAALAATGRTDPRCVAEWMMANRADELRRTLAGFAPRMLGGSEVVDCTSGRQDCNAEPATAGDLFSWLVASDRRSAMMIWTAAPPFRRPTPRPDVPVPAGKPKKGGSEGMPATPLSGEAPIAMPVRPDPRNSDDAGPSWRAAYAGGCGARFL